MPKLRRLPLGKRYTAITALLFAIGTAITLYARYQTDSWLQGALVNIGTTLLLFSPLLLLGRGVEQRLNRVESAQEGIAVEQQHTAASVAELSSEVSRTRDELANVRQSLGEAVATRLAASREADLALFEAVRQSPSRDVLLQALARATSLGLITDRGPRVAVPATNLCLRFARYEYNFSEYDPAPDLQAYFEDDSGALMMMRKWTGSGEDVAAVDVVVTLVEALQQLGTYPGDEAFDPSLMFNELAGLLHLAYVRITRLEGSCSLGRLIQLFPPAWALTESELVSLTDESISVPIESLKTKRLQQRSMIRTQASTREQ